MMKQKDILCKKKQKKNRKIIWFSLIIVIFSVAFYSFDEGRDFKLVKNVEVFSNLLRELNYFYVDKPDPEKLIKTGINAMLKTLDPKTLPTIKSGSPIQTLTNVDATSGNDVDIASNIPINIVLILL